MIYLARSRAAAWLAEASRSAFWPRRTPRTFAACSAAMIRDAIISRSCSATAARICRVSRGVRIIAGDELHSGIHHGDDEGHIAR